MTHRTQTNSISSDRHYQQRKSPRNPALRGSWLSSWAPHPPDPPPDSHLPSPHLDWEKTCLSRECFPQNPYRAICASDLEYSDDGLMDSYTYPPLSLRRNQKSVPIFLVLAKGDLVTLPVLSCPGPQTQRSPSNQTSLSQMITLMSGYPMTHLMLRLHQVKHSTNKSVIIAIMASSLQNRSLTLSNICLALYFYLSKVILSLSMKH